MRLGVAVLASAVALAGCGSATSGGGDTPSPSLQGSTPAPPPGLEALVLAEEDAPEGTDLRPDESGHIRVEEFTANPEERAAYRGFGYAAGFRAIFAAPATRMTPPERPEGTFFSVTSQVARFEDADGAGRAFAFIHGRFRNRENYQGEVAELGPEAFRLGGALTVGPNAPSHYFSYTWRVDDVLLIVYAEGAEGEITPEDVLVLAQSIDTT